jgi:pimeloyl-ACP methyl ester carboxylesterase
MVTKRAGSNEQQQDHLRSVQQNKVKAELIIIPGAGHGFQGDDAKRASAAMVAWFEQTLLKTSPKARP